MKLQEFVSETLVQLLSGVQDAQKVAKDKGARIEVMQEGAKYGNFRKIEFDVGLCDDGRGHLAVGPGENRIKFEVQVYMPVG